MWEFDVTMGNILHFEYFYRKIYRGVGKILYSFHKKGEFSNNVINRMRVSRDLKVIHPFPGVKSPSDFSAGKKADIWHLNSQPWPEANGSVEYLLFFPAEKSDGLFIPGNGWVTLRSQLTFI